MTTKKSSLSTWLPTAIRQGVADMLETLRNPKYTIDMRRWYCPKKCTVCLAGAVMVARCNITEKLETLDQIRPEHVEDQISEKVLCALDYIRLGWGSSAIHRWISSRADPVFFEMNSEELKSVIEYAYPDYVAHAYISFSKMFELADRIEVVLLNHGYHRPLDDEEIYISDAMLEELETLAGRK